MAKKYLIYGITKDSGYLDDPDAAINKYYYWRVDSSGEWIKRWDWRQNVVNRVKNGEVVAYSYLNGEQGALCVIKIFSNGVEFLKTVPNGNPWDNLSNLPEYN